MSQERNNKQTEKKTKRNRNKKHWKSDDGKKRKQKHKNTLLIAHVLKEARKSIKSFTQFGIHDGYNQPWEKCHIVVINYSFKL